MVDAFEPARKAIYWTIAGVVITFVVIASAFILVAQKERLTSVNLDLKAQLLSQRFTNLAECFAYEDNVRVYPGVIDWSKFTQERLDNCYTTDPNTGQNEINFRIGLEYRDKELKTNNYFNIDHSIIKRHIIIQDGDERTVDSLIIYVQEMGRR